jgi:beta-glucuronidase
MKKILFLLLCTLATVAEAQAVGVLQNVYGRKTTSLNGWWQVIIDPYDAGFYDYRMQPSHNGFFMNAKPRDKGDHVEYDFSKNDQLYVPQDWNIQRRELFFYEGSVWYKKDFKYSLKKDRLLYLYFAAANYQTDVWLNGTKLGTHVGGFTPFFFDITQQLQKGENIVQLYGVSADQTATSGWIGSCSSKTPITAPKLTPTICVKADSKDSLNVG